MNSIFAIAGVVIKELYRRKDFYVLLVLTGVITAALGSMNFFNDSSIVRYLREMCLLLIWIFSLVICITTAARQIPAERENRTMFPLLAKPVTRWHVVVGKFLGCWAACGIALFVFYLFFAVVSESRGHSPATPTAAVLSAGTATNAVVATAKTDDPDHDHDHDHDKHETSAPRENSAVISYIQALWLHWMMLGIITAMVLCGSIVFAAPSSNATICFVVVAGILFVGGHLHKVALGLMEPIQTILTTIYFVIPHLEWYDIRDLVINDRPHISWLACGGASLYAVVYILFFLVAAWMAFRRKMLSV